MKQAPKRSLMNIQPTGDGQKFETEQNHIHLRSSLDHEGARNECNDVGKIDQNVDDGIVVDECPGFDAVPKDVVGILEGVQKSSDKHKMIPIDYGENAGGDSDLSDCECPYSAMQDCSPPQGSRPCTPTVERTDNKGCVSSVTTDDDKNLDNSLIKPLPQRNLCLPDIDDMSMKHVLAYVKIYHRDMAWSYLSDSFFLVGSTSYLILCVWDWLWTEADTTIWYRTLDIIAPAVYVLNSIIDTRWSVHVMKRDNVKRSMQQGWNEWRTVFLDDDNILIADSFCTSPCNPGMPASVATQSWQTQIRKHVAHRRSLLAALTFGIAALSEFISRFVPQYDSQLSLLSVHSYVLSAIIAVTGKRVRPWLATSSSSSSSNYLFWDPEMLEDLGDLLFLVGCMVDATVTDFDIEAPIMSVFSSCLWLIDACLYFRADVVRFDQDKETSRDPNYLI